MNVSTLEKYTTRRADGEPASAGQSDVPDDLGAFGWLRGVRDRAIMLELRHKDGHVTALGYAWLERAELNPSEGITLYFSGKTVRLIGRQLHAEVRPNVRLFTGIVRHRVPWIQEASGPDMLEASPEMPVIETIELK